MSEEEEALPKLRFIELADDYSIAMLNAHAPPSSPDSVTLRIIHVNDVYELTMMPHLKTLVDKWSSGSANRTLVSCGGDFLAPSLLSGLDYGAGMVACLNALPTSHVIFGNHECDVPHKELLARISEFRGTWINSNFPAITAPPLPSDDIVTATSTSGAHSRRVALLGLLCDYKHLYRKSAFNGLSHTIEPPLACAERLCACLRGAVDAIVPLTHLDQPDDERLAARATELGIAAVLGGHDHGVTLRGESGVAGAAVCPLAKAGMDATHAAVLDLTWEAGTAGDGAPPVVRCVMEPVAQHAPDTVMAALVRRHMTKVYALGAMVLVSNKQLVEARPPSAPLPSSAPPNTRSAEQAARRGARPRSALRSLPPRRCGPCTHAQHRRTPILFSPSRTVSTRSTPPRTRPLRACSNRVRRRRARRRDGARQPRGIRRPVQLRRSDR